MAKAAVLNIDIIAVADKALGEFEKVKKKATDTHAAMKLAALGAATAIVGGLTEATKAAAEHEVNVSRLATAYKDAGLSSADMSSSLEEIEARSRRTGQSTEDNVQAYTRLVAATRNTEEAHKDLAVAQDLAAFKGTSVEEAALAITRAQQGNTRALKEMGIATTDTSGKQLTASALMAKLTQAVKGQADAFGDTATGKMARYHEALDQTKEKIGEAVLPAFKQLLDMLQPVFAWLARNQAILKVLVPILAGLAAVIYTVTVAIRVWNAVQKILDAELWANPIALVVLAIAGLVAAVILAYKHFAWFRDAISTVWGVLKVLGDWVMGHWRIIVGILLGPIGFLVLNLGFVKQLIQDIIHALEAIGHAVSSALGWLGKLPSKAGGLLGKLSGGVLSAPPGPAPAPIYMTIYATPGDDLPQVVYDAMRRYQRQHVRPELRPMFGS